MKIYSEPFNYLQWDQNKNSGNESIKSEKREMLPPMCDVFISDEAWAKYREEIQEKNKSKTECDIQEQPDIIAIGKWYDRLREKEQSIYDDMRKKHISYGFSDIISISSYAYSSLYQEIEQKYAGQKTVDRWGLTKEKEIEQLDIAFETVMGWNMMAMNSRKMIAEARAKVYHDPLKYIENKKTQKDDEDELKRIMQKIKGNIIQNSKGAKERDYKDVSSMVASVLNQHQTFTTKMEWLFKDFGKM